MFLRFPNAFTTNRQNVPIKDTRSILMSTNGISIENNNFSNILFHFIFVFMIINWLGES